MTIEKFTALVASAKRIAPMGCLSPADIVGLQRRARTMAIDNHTADLIIAGTTAAEKVSRRTGEAIGQTVTILTNAEYGVILIDQDMPSAEHCAFVCPSCHAVQSGVDHIKAGKEKAKAILSAGVVCADPECLGTEDRHTMKISDKLSGKLVPVFAPATPEQALLLLSTRDQKDIQPVPELTWAEGELE